MQKPVLRFIHTADCHLDAPLSGLRGVDRGMADTLQRLQRESFAAIINHCVEQAADFLIIAGDLFDTSSKNIRTQVELKRQFEQLRDAGIGVYIAAGNHDNLEESGYLSRGLDITLPENVHIFSGDFPESFEFEKPGGAAVRITGMSFARRDISDNLALQFPKRSGDEIAIGVLHTSLAGSSEHAAYAPCALDDLLSRSCDYWALGHIHARGVIQENPAVVYPGCPQARRRRETGVMSVTLVDVMPDRSCILKEIPTGALEMHDVDCDITGVDEGIYGDMAARIRAACDSLRARLGPHVRGAFARVRLHGEGPMHILKTNPWLPEHGVTAIEYIEKSLKPEGAEPAPFVRLRFIDPSGCAPERARFDIDALRGEVSLMGGVVRLCDRAREDESLRNELAQSALASALRESTKTADKNLFFFLEQAAETSGETAAPVNDDEIDAAMEICLSMLRPDDS